MAAKQERNGHLAPRKTISCDGADSWQGHEAGADCAVIAASGGTALFPAPEGLAGIFMSFIFHN